MRLLLGVPAAAALQLLALAAAAPLSTATGTGNLNCLPDDNAVDCAALSDLATSTLVHQWKKGTGWPGGPKEAGEVEQKPKSFCKWHGVNCSKAGRVTVLDLSHNNLGGSLPASLGNLEMLESLQIGGSRPDGYGLGGKSCMESGSTNFNGSGFPASMYKLKNLVTLTGENACLGGTISSAIGGMSSLRDIEIHANYISGTLPKELDDLEFLANHKLGRNPISGTLPAFTKPKKMLEKYNCNFCALTGTFPDNFSPEMFPKLSQAFWDGNGFTGALPGSIGSLKTMQSMSFNINHFSGDFPESFCETASPDCRIGADSGLAYLKAYQAVYPWVLNVTGNRYKCPNGVPKCIQPEGVCNHTSAPHAGQEVTGSPVVCTT